LAKTARSVPKSSRALHIKVICVSGFTILMDRDSGFWLLQLDNSRAPNAVPITQGKIRGRAAMVSLLRFTLAACSLGSLEPRKKLLDMV
jgi:hypothetical protein